MSAVLQLRVTHEEYLAKERDADTKSEYYAGQIFSMVGGTPTHNTIAGNTLANIHSRLQGTSCRPFNSDQRIRIQANGLATYPDVSVVCGGLQLDPRDSDAINNPKVIVEVLSKTTESYDRGKKFNFYRLIDSLQEYLLISQDEAHVECFRRQDNGDWILSIYKGLENKLKLFSIEAELLLAEVYEYVVFQPGT